MTSDDSRSSYFRLFIVAIRNALPDLDSQPKQMCYMIYAEHLPPTFYYENSKHREGEEVLSSGGRVTTTWSPQLLFHLIRFNTDPSLYPSF